METVEGIRCTRCGTVVWSTHVHDMVYCECKAVAVDGGREYTKITGDPIDFAKVNVVIVGPSAIRVENLPQPKPWKRQLSD
jgi:DNA-binding helix-hairpin-helix protein with protein kinase domain